MAHDQLESPPARNTPVRVVTSSAAAMIRDEQPLTFTDLVRFLLRQWRTILLGCLIGALIAVLWTMVLSPREYEAFATLVLMPPPIASGLQPGMLSIQGVQRLLESDAVIYETARQLVADGHLEEGEEAPEAGDELVSRIYTSRREEGRALAPIVELVARAESPEAAAATANTWGGKLLDALQSLKGESLMDNIELVESQYAKSKTVVEALDEQRLEAAEGFADNLAKAKKRWQREISKIRVATEQDLVQLEAEWEQRQLNFHLESRRLIEGVVSASGLSLGDDAGTEQAATGEVVGPAAAAQLRKVMRLRVQLAQTPEFLTLEKTVSDDAVWQAAVLREANLLTTEVLPGLRLLDQEINETYSELANRLSLTDFELESQLSEGNREAVRKVTAEMEELQRRRTAGLKQLLAEQAQALEEMQESGARRLEELRIERDREISDLERRRDARISHLEQLATDARTHFSVLAEKYSQAELARREQQLPDVRLAARAVPPSEPRSRWLALKTMIGLFLGGLIGATLALVREIAAL